MASDSTTGSGTAFFERRLGAWRRALVVGAVLLAVQLPMELHYDGWATSVPLRVAWVALLVVATLLIRSDHPRLTRLVAYAVGLTSGVLASAIVAVTGGSRGPRFSYLLAFPLVLAVLLPDVPWAVAAMGVGTLTGGVLILSREQDAWFIAEWAALSAVATGLALYGTLASRKLLRSEIGLQTAHAEVLVRLAGAERASAVGRMAAAVAHHVSNPLSVVKANAAFLQRSLTGGSLDPEVEQALEETVECTDRIARLLAVLRGLAPAKPEPPTQCTLDTMVEEAARLASVRPGDAEILLEPALPPVWVGQRGLLVALVGLLSEASRAAAARRGDGSAPLLVSVKKEADHVALSIVERPSAHQPALPEASRGEAIATNLALFRELVERSGASFRSSAKPGGGAELEIRAPIASGPAGESAG